MRGKWGSWLLNQTQRGNTLDEISAGVHSMIRLNAYCAPFLINGSRTQRISSVTYESNIAFLKKSVPFSIIIDISFVSQYPKASMLAARPPSCYGSRTNGLLLLTPESIISSI